MRAVLIGWRKLRPALIGWRKLSSNNQTCRIVIFVMILNDLPIRWLVKNLCSNWLAEFERCSDWLAEIERCSYWLCCIKISILIGWRKLITEERSRNFCNFFHFIILIRLLAGL